MPFKDPLKARKYYESQARRLYMQKYNAMYAVKHANGRKLRDAARREKDKVREAKWRELNCEAIRLRQQRWRAQLDPKKKAKYLEGHREWARKNKDHCLKYERNWISLNRDRVNERSRARKAKLKSNPSAVAFYKLVRSKPKIQCYYCQKWIPGKEAHIDHVIALAKNGNHASENLCASCANCNLQKNTKLPSEISFVNQPLLNL